MHDILELPEVSVLVFFILFWQVSFTSFNVVVGKNIV
jgi:hypothetical protein